LIRRAGESVADAAPQLIAKLFPLSNPEVSLDYMAVSKAHTIPEHALQRRLPPHE